MGKHANEQQPLLGGRHPGKTKRTQRPRAKPQEQNARDSEAAPLGLVDMPDDILGVIFAKVLDSAYCSVVIDSGADKQRSTGRMRSPKVMSQTALALAPTLAHLSTLRATHRRIRILVDDLFRSKDFCQRIGDRIVHELDFGDQLLSLKDEKEIHQVLLRVPQSLANGTPSQSDEKKYINNPDRQELTGVIQRAAKTIDLKRAPRAIIMRRECLEHPKAFGVSYGILVGLSCPYCWLGGSRQA